MDHFPEGESALIIPGPEGDLEALTTGPKSDPDGPGNVTIACHPHSLMGGTMNNKVVHTVARARRDMGHRVIRFNFRGVEKSQGAFANGVGEQEDLLAVIDWVRQVRPDDNIYLSGFSFGSYVAAAGCLRAVKRGDAIRHLLLIAPAVENFAFDILNRFPCPLSVVYGDADEVVSSEAMAQWAGNVQSPKQIYCLPGAGHFFHGRLTEVKSILSNEAGV